MNSYAIAVFVLGAVAQVGRLWTFSDLVGESDVVLIANVSDVRDTGRKAIHPVLRPDIPVIEIETRIHVLALLKGSDEAQQGRELLVHHYRIDMDEWRRRHPAAPGQPPAGLVNAGGELTSNVGNCYLFFLKRSTLGWEPTSGHVFPQDSAFRLEGASRIRR